MSKLNDFIDTEKARIEAEWEGFVNSYNVDLYMGQELHNNPDGTLFRVRSAFGGECQENFSNNFCTHWLKSRLSREINKVRKAKTIRVCARKALELVDDAWANDYALKRMWEMSSAKAWFDDSNIAYTVVDDDCSWNFNIKLAPNDAMLAKLRFGVTEKLT